MRVCKREDARGARATRSVEGEGEGRVLGAHAASDGSGEVSAGGVGEAGVHRLGRVVAERSADGSCAVVVIVRKGGCSRTEEERSCA